MKKPFHNAKAVKLNPWWLAFIHLLLFILLTDCKRPTDPVVLEPSTQVGNLMIGESKAGVSQEIGMHGGKVQISDPTSPLNGFKIEVHSGAYAESRTFNVSYAPVQKHDFGTDLTVLSPLITVENGGDFAQLLMSVSIAIQLPNNYHACVFMFDDTGDFSILPTRKLLPNQLTVDASHFTQITPVKGGRVGTETGRRLLVVASDFDDLNLVEYDTKFKPDIDDWAFPNLGSHAYPDGLCSGMSLTALWYYNFMKDQLGNGSLRDNKLVANPYFEKPSNVLIKDKYWTLNSSGVKFASMIQGLQHQLIFRWSALTANDVHLFTYYEFAQYYKYNKNPKPDYMIISSKDGKSSHAILVVGKTKTGLKIVDPNKTEISDLAFSFPSFEDYSSSLRSDGTSSIYDGFIRLPDFDYSYINTKWLEVKNSTIGQDCFPNYSYEIRTDNKQIKLINGIAISKDFSLINTDKNTVLYLFSIDAANKITALGANTLNKVYSVPDGTVKVGIVHTIENLSLDCSGNIPTNRNFQWAGVKWFTVNINKTANTYFSSKVNDKSIDMKYQGYGLRDNTYQIINGYQYNGDDQDYKVGAMLLEMQINKSLFKGVGSYNLNATDGQAFLYTIKEIDSKTRAHRDYIHSPKNSSGTLTITSLTNDFIEGTFNFTALEAYFGTGNGQTMVITDGKFGAKIK